MRASGNPKGFLGAVPVKSPGLLYGHTHTLGTFSTQISGIYASPHKNFPWLRYPGGKTILFFTHSQISWLREQCLINIAKSYRCPYVCQGQRQIPTPRSCCRAQVWVMAIWGEEGWQALHVVMNAPELEHCCGDICIAKQARHFIGFWAAGVNFKGKT